MFASLILGTHQLFKHLLHIGLFGFNGNGCRSEGILLNVVYIGLNSVRKGKNKGNADNSDASCKGGKNCSCLFGHKIVKGEGECREEGHRRLFLLLCLFLFPFVYRGFFGLFYRGNLCGIGIGVADNLTVKKTDNSGRILLRKLGVVCYHYNKLITGNFLQQSHNLNTCLRVKRTRRLVGKKNMGIINKGTGNGNSLHLSARHLVRLFVNLVAESNLFKGFGSPFSALCL